MEELWREEKDREEKEGLAAVRKDDRNLGNKFSLYKLFRPYFTLPRWYFVFFL